MKQLVIAFVLSLSTPLCAVASEDHGMMQLCKAECPSAKTEDEAHKCMDEVVKKKKADKLFRKSDCYAAYREHEKHEKQEGHKQTGRSQVSNI